MRFHLLLMVLCLAACTPRPAVVHSQDSDLVAIQLKIADRTLSSINVIDRNGLSETISAKDRVKTFANTNFLTAQPYQKVLRVFAKDKSGTAFSIITSYYPTGQIKQYLEVENGRAHGRYVEWHQNGQKKLLATVLGGNADLDEKSQNGWLFDKESICWNQEGTLIAKMPYSKGVLEGACNYYNNDGKLIEELPYHKGELEGIAKVFALDGTTLEKTTYKNGLKNGSAEGLWNSVAIAWKEEWKDDLLVSGSYYNKDGKLIAQVTDGTGKRALFGDEALSEVQEYRSGKPEGEVLLFDEQGTITRRLHVKDNEKHGEEIYYYPTLAFDSEPKPKLCIEWNQGKMQGVVKSWYQNGVQESSREMSRNVKQGLLTAWYKDGKLMMIEEYENERLKRGDYLKKGDTKPISQVIDGKGIATFFDPDGTFIRRVTYYEGRPVDEE